MPAENMRTLLKKAVLEHLEVLDDRFKSIETPQKRYQAITDYSRVKKDLASLLGQELTTAEVTQLLVRKNPADVPFSSQDNNVRLRQRIEKFRDSIQVGWNSPLVRNFLVQPLIKNVPLLYASSDLKERLSAILKKHDVASAEAMDADALSTARTAADTAAAQRDSAEERAANLQQQLEAERARLAALQKQRSSTTEPPRANVATILRVAPSGKRKKKHKKRPEGSDASHAQTSGRPFSYATVVGRRRPG